MPVVNRIAFTLFGLPVYWYGVIMALSIAGGLLLCILRERSLGFPRDTAIDLALWIVPIALVFARLYYVAFSLDQYWANPLSVFDVRSGGMAIYGAVIGGVLTGLVYCRIRRANFWALADLVAPALALGQAVGRWGNYLNQEAFGFPVSSPALTWFPLSVFIEADGLWHLATFFYESVWCLLICLLLLIAERRKWFKHSGDALLWYALLYAFERMVVEGLRTDSLMLGPLRVSQLLSVLVMLAAAALLLIRRTQKGRPTP